MNAVRAARASILLALVLVLSGCGLTGRGFQPGVAVVVEDSSISAEHIDELTGAYCKGIDETLKERDQKVSMRYLSAQVVVPQLTIKLLVEELADDLGGVEPTEQYRAELSALRSRVTELDEDAADAVVEVESARAYYIDVLTTIGTMQGGESGGAEGAADSLTVGRNVLSRWMVSGSGELRAQPVEEDSPLLAINPQYGLRFAESEQENNEEGPLIRAETDVSYAFSDLAKGGLAPDTVEDPAYLEKLPSRMVCG